MDSKRLALPLLSPYDVRDVERLVKGGEIFPFSRLKELMEMQLEILILGKMSCIAICDDD